MASERGFDGPHCVELRDAEGLEAYGEALEELAAHAAEPNVYYEPWMLIPAARWLGRASEPRFVVVLSEACDGGCAETVAIGLFPVELSRRYDRFPIRTVRLWQHDKCFLCVPLLRRRWEQEALRAFLDWVGAGPLAGAVLEFNEITAGGPFQRALVGVLRERRQANVVEEAYARPMLSPEASCEAFLEKSISKRHQKDIERKERRLAALGHLEYVSLDGAAGEEEWVTRFLEIELAGWKGSVGTALAQIPGDAEFFREVIARGRRKGQLAMLGLRLDGQLIAIKCNLRSGPVCFAFMIAFDERYAAYSPGLLLEMENIRQAHRDPAVSRVDSCADPSSPMFTRIWNDTVLIQRMVASNGRPWGDLRAASIPLLRCFSKAARRIWRGAGVGNSIQHAPGERVVGARTAESRATDLAARSTTG